MKLVTNGLHSTMEYNAATMIASSHLGNAVVLSHCTENKSQLLHIKYNDAYLFGVLPLSSRTLFASDNSKVSVCVVNGLKCLLFNLYAPSLLKKFENL